MFGNLTGWHLIIVLVVILLIFGATRLPALARSIGQSTKILKEELKSDKPDDASKTTSEAAAPETTSSTSAKSSDTV